MFNKGLVQKGLMVLVLIVLVVLPLGGCGTQPTKVYHVGILSGLDAFSGIVDGFKAKMTSLGYVEGKNITYDVQSTNVDTAAYKAAIGKFVSEKVDLILAFPTEAAMEAKADTKGTNIPVVFALAFTDVPGVNLIDSVQKPGGNITGVRWGSADTASKRLQVLLQMAPNAKRVFAPYLKGYPNVPGQLDAIRPQAQAAGVQLIEFPATAPQDLQNELDQLTTSDGVGFDAVLMLVEPLGITPDFYSLLGNFCYAHRIPIGGAIMEPDGHASLFGLLPKPEIVGADAATQADKIFKGTPVGSVPVLTSESYFQINLKAAQALGVTVPEGLIKQADNVLH
ncbi:MAG TPA: ABC transporter substrate-binding protein [Anaerolineales bacterium]|nr:ABC transporter substrate-binding protein [Anaerolineales bacterium]